MGVPALPDGTQLPAAPDFDTRATRSCTARSPTHGGSPTPRSLFDYDSGKSTASYTDHNFPSDADDAALAGALASPDPNQQAAAQSACAGVTDSDLLADCEFDVYATGDEGFAQQYLATEDLYDLGISPPTFVPPTQGPATGATKVVELQGLDGATIGPDDTIYVSVTDSSGAAQLLAIEPHHRSDQATGADERSDRHPLRCRICLGCGPDDRRQRPALLGHALRPGHPRQAGRRPDSVHGH